MEKKYEDALLKICETANDKDNFVLSCDLEIHGDEYYEVVNYLKDYGFIENPMKIGKTYIQCTITEKARAFYASSK